jgi:hypothetical protein
MKQAGGRLPLPLLVSPKAWIEVRERERRVMVRENFI